MYHSEGGLKIEDTTLGPHIEKGFASTIMTSVYYYMFLLLSDETLSGQRYALLWGILRRYAPQNNNLVGTHMNFSKVNATKFLHITES